MKKIRFIIMIMFVFISISHADDKAGLFDMLEDARRGDTEAMCDLGIAYFKGENTLKDPFKAKCWIKKAYDKGSNRAEILWDDMQLWKFSGKCKESFDDEPLPRYSKGDVIKDLATAIRFVFVPKGFYLMGCHDKAEKCRQDEKPRHKVFIDGFWMSQVEVTQKLWQSIMGNNPARFNSSLDRPVENISFNEVQKFIQVLNSKSKDKFSLPTEAQWEYACRNGGGKTIFPWGDKSYRPYANCATCDSGSFYGETAPVGSFPPNELGFYDMAGNVKEWCQDVYSRKSYDRTLKNNSVFDSQSQGSSRVVRGGSFTDNTSNLRCTSRYKFLPDMKSDYIGFRLVMTHLN